MITLRASSLPLVTKCRAAAESPDVRIVESSDAANLGTAAHKLFERIVIGSADSVLDDDVAEMAERHGVDATELRVLWYQARKLWALAPRPSALADGGVEFAPPSVVCGDVMVTGHLDGVLVDEDRSAYVYDWKTGRVDTDHRAQLRAYAALVMLDDVRLEKVTATILWVRDGEIETYTMTRADLLAWEEETAGLETWDGSYHPGAHCTFCPRAHECPAKIAKARADVAAITTTDAESVGLMAPAQIIQLHRAARNAAAAAKRAQDAIREHIAAHGPVEADGAQLVITTEERRELDVVKAWPVLEAHGFDDRDFGECVEISASAAEDRVVKKTVRGKGAAAVRSFREALAAAGAVTTKTIHKLKEKRT